MSWTTHVAIQFSAPDEEGLSKVRADALSYAILVTHCCKQQWAKREASNGLEGKPAILVCIQILWKLMLHKL